VGVLFFACLALAFLSLFFIINTSYPDLNLITKPKNSRLKVKGERTGVELMGKDTTGFRPFSNMKDSCTVRIDKKCHFLSATGVFDPPQNPIQFK